MRGNELILIKISLLSSYKCLMAFPYTVPPNSRCRTHCTLRGVSTSFRVLVDDTFVRISPVCLRSLTLPLGLCTTKRGFSSVVSSMWYGGSMQVILCGTIPQNRTLHRKSAAGQSIAWTNDQAAKETGILKARRRFFPIFFCFFFSCIERSVKLIAQGDARCYKRKMFGHQT